MAAIPVLSQFPAGKTRISASILTAVKAIIPNSAAISQLIRNDSATEMISSGRSRMSAIRGTLIMSDPMIRIGSTF